MWRLPSMRPATHQDVFLERYSWLLSRALWLTGHDRELSEDLVQEAFVQFSLRAPDLATIESVDAYLYVMIRNLRLSHLRRAGREKTCSLSAFDLDTAPDLAGTPSVHVGLAISEDLWRVCDWACRRKESSKAGSVLLLRFVHGYDPREIALIMQSPTRAVDDWLRLARREASLEIATMATPLDGPVHSMPAGDIVAALRGRVFAARHTSCHSRAALEALYAEAEGRSTSSTVLAHLVSCPTCLDIVNQLLDLRGRNQRDPRDMLGPHDRGPGDGGRVTRGPGHDLRSRLRRRVQNVSQHRPLELRVAVNGFIVGTQRVNSDRSEQTLAVNIEEPIGFVEVFSEDDVRLLYATIAPPPEGNATQSVRIVLSDGRSLAIEVDFAGAWPMLSITYLDPGYAQQPEAARVVAGLQTAAAGGERPGTSWIGNWLPGGAFARVALLRAALAAGCLVLVLASVGLFTSRTLTAAELLRQSRLTEDRYLTRPGMLTRRVLRFSELEPGSRRPLARHRVESWRDPGTGRHVRRYYVDGGRLVAGEWFTKGSGSAVYSSGLPVVRSTEFTPAAALASGDAWRLDLSTAVLERLLRADAGSVTRSGNRLVLSFGRGAIAGVPGLEEVTLSLVGDDRRLVEASFLLRHGGRQRLFSLTEDRVEHVPSGGVSPDVFEPEAALLPPAPIPQRATKRPRSPNEILNLELDAHWRLDTAGALLGEQISVDARADELRVHGVVDTAQRRKQLEAALGPLSSHPAVRVDLKTAAETLGAAPPPNAPVIVRNFEVGSARAPAYAHIRQFVTEQSVLPGEPAIDARVEEISAQLLERARRTLLHARALGRLSARLTPDATARLDLTRRQQWKTMLVTHLSSIASESTVLADELGPIFAGDEVMPPPVGRSIVHGEFVDGIARLNALATRQDRLTRELLTVSDRPLDGLPGVVSNLKVTLREARDLAEELRARASGF